MEYICDICNKAFDSINGCKTHYCLVHSPTKEQKQRFFTLLHEKHFCPICGKQILYNLNGSRNFNKTCSAKCASKLNAVKQSENFVNDPSKREEKRRQRLNYLTKKEHFTLTAWGRRTSNAKSYLEQWFIDNILEKYTDILSKFDIINEYHFLGYSCDFAFLNIPLDVELDGRQHFKNGKKRVEHDIARDNKFLDKGWKIYRITYKEIENDPDKTVQNFIDFITNINYYSSKTFDYGLYIRNKTFNEIKKNKEKKKREDNKKIKFLERKRKICDVIDGVDFIDYSKQGWVEKLKRIFIKHNILYDKNISRLLHKYYPEFFNNNNVFYRKGSIYFTNK